MEEHEHKHDRSRCEELKQRIQQLEAESRLLRKQIHSAKGAERNALWGEKRSLGMVTRAYRLARAFQQGKPYRAHEPSPNLEAPAYWLRSYVSESEMTEPALRFWILTPPASVAKWERGDL